MVNTLLPLAAQGELTEKRKQMAGYLAAYKEVKAELRDRDAVIAELQEKLLPSSQPPTPVKIHGAHHVRCPFCPLSTGSAAVGCTS